MRLVVAALTAIFIVNPPANAQSLRGLFGKPKRQDSTTEVMVAMRDGVKLATNVTLPKGKGPWPVVLTRTPYNKDEADSGLFFVDYVGKGFVRVVQDCRGRYKSEGEFGTFYHEPTDGYDTIAWIAEQPWCDGNVGTFGISAGGVTSNFAAMTTPPALKCSFVCVAHGCDYRYGVFPGGVFLKDLNERWFQSIGEELPPSQTPRIEPYTDEYASRDMTKNYANVRIPIFNVGGWYDIFSDSTVENFAGLQRFGGEGAKGNQKLWMGSFGHFPPLSGRLRYPIDSGRLELNLVLPWFEHWLKGIDNEIATMPAARYFVLGDPFDENAPGNEWRTASEWPPASTATSYYLSPAGHLLDHAGKSSDKLTYRYDPKDPVPTVGGNNLFSARGPMDQREVSGRPDILRFETAPLEAPTEIIGRAKVELFVSTDAEDTDFVAKLIDVYPDGYEALVSDQPLRLRYHAGYTDPQHIEAHKVYRIEIPLWATALVFNRGHKIAIHITSSNAPRFEAHTNTWDPLPSYDDAMVANNTLYLGPEHPSRLILPVTKVYGGAEASSNTAAK